MRPPPPSAKRSRPPSASKPVVLPAFGCTLEELDLYMLAQPPPLAAVGWILPPRSWGGGGRMASAGSGSAKPVATPKRGTDCLPWSADRATYA